MNPYDINDYAEAAMRLYGVKIGEYRLAREYGVPGHPLPWADINGRVWWPETAPSYDPEAVYAEIVRFKSNGQ